MVPPEINQPSKGHPLIVGRDPGSREMELGHPFVGPSGQLLDEILAEAGLRRQDVNIANVVDVQPPENKFELHNPSDVERGVYQLNMLIKQLQPSLIIALGNEAAYATVDGWPTRGNGIYGAKSIVDRRGYFWDSRGSTVLTSLHPSGVLRKAVPGRFLLGHDLRRARRFLTGDLNREAFPKVWRMLRDYTPAYRGQLVAWDIETKWDGGGLTCCGFCGSDLQPVVAVYPQEFKQFAVPILLDPTIRKVGHNGKFDLAEIKHLEKLEVQSYTDDTQQMWWALEPEIAGDDDAGGDEFTSGSKRMTRKGLAFLASLYFNVEWWKNYPELGDPDYIPRITTLNGIDCWITYRLAQLLLKRIKDEDVEFQYQQAMDAFPALLDMQDEGLIVDEELRQERIKILTERKDKGADKVKAVALEYIIQNDIPAFRKMKKCTCCGGGKKQAQHCIICSGLTVKWDKEKGIVWKDTAKHHGCRTIKEFKDGLPVCRVCNGTGKIAEYSFNPFSPPQMKKLLYDVIGVPKSEFKGKVMMDEDAMKKIMRWART